jgi:anti-sigma28 factor (negative regulator of flagellin synthesis)
MKTIWIAAGVGMVAVFGLAAAANAQAAPQQQASAQSTPKGWNYEIKDGKRVPKSNRVTNADGSWREEIRQGKCTTVKEKTANGEYKETRSCD